MADWNTRIKTAHGFAMEDFRTPPAFLGPVYSWVWNAPTDEETLIRQIDEMELAGIRAFYIIPEPPEFRPATMVTAMTPAYLSPEYFAMVRLAVEYARQKGMLVWIYDEGGWPSGNACGQLVKARPDLAGKRLDVREVTLKAGEAYTPGENAAAAFLDRKRVLPGTAFDEETVVREYFRSLAKIGVNPVQPDLLEPETVPLFIRMTHERYYEALGDLAAEVIPCVFIDEPLTAMPALPWDFTQRFLEEYGYDLTDYLYVLLEKDGLTAAEEKARQDYAELLTKLLVRRFMQPIEDWCRAHNLIFTGHLDKDHAMDQYRSYYGNPMRLIKKLDMPGIDVIWRQIWPGEKPVAEGESFFPRMAASAAAQSGSLYTLSESFGVYGQNLTFEDMRWVANYQHVRGIQILNPMIIPYGREGALAFGERPYFCREMPGYTHLTDFNRHMSRVSYFVSCGLPVTDTALYLPAEQFWSGREREEAALQAYHALGEAMEADGIDFDIIDRETLLEGRVKDGRLCVGLAEYSRILVPGGIPVPEDISSVLALLSGETRYPARSSHPAIRLRTRRDEGGEMYIMAFCQSTEPVCGEITVETERPLYQADASEGSVKLLAGEAVGHQTLSVRLEPGQELLIMTGGEKLEVSEAFKAGSVITAKALSCRRSARLVLTEKGMARDETVKEHSPTEAFAHMEGEDFSGEITYEFAFELTGEQAAHPAVLTLERLEHSASVWVNGQHAGYMTLKPLRLTLPAALLTDGENRLVIEAANTASNAYNRVDPLDWFDEAHVGPYNEREQVMERERADGGLFGPVRVETGEALSL